MMKNSQIRQLFNKARKIASRFAEMCDFAAAKEIKEAQASCAEGTAYAGAVYKDRVERCQICTVDCGSKRTRLGAVTSAMRSRQRRVKRREGE